MRSPRMLFFALVLLVLGSCQDALTPLAPEPPEPNVELPTEESAPLDAISDAVNEGNPHFFWLPPMVGQPGEFNGPFDGSLNAIVRICDLSDCAGTTIEQFSVSAGSVTVEDEIYKAEWDTDASSATAGTTYRMTVSVATTEIGYADVVLAPTGGEAKNLTTDEIIGLKDGRTLPIQFRLEEGAVFVVDPAVGQTIQALAGEVKVAVPPGALTEETAITVQKTTTTGSALTSVTFGPAGTTFSEPVPVTIGYDPSALPSGVTEADLALNLLDDQGRWIVLPGSVVDDVTDEVTAPFHHFSTGGAGPAELAIFCPGDGVPETFELLEDAVSAVVEGGTIEVCDGTHTVVQETVDKAVTFEGAAGTLPTITTGGAQFGITFAFASGTTTIRNLRFETLWNLGFDHVVGSALLIGGPGPLPYDQVVIEDVELHVANGSSGENAGSGAWIFSSNVAGAHVTVRNVTATGGGAGLNILTLSEATLGASVDVLNSSFSSPGRNGIRVASLSANSASGAISDVDIDNVDVTAGLGVFVLGGNGGVGGRVDVTNSTFSGGAGMWYQNGGSGLIQNNTIACGHSNACIRVRSDGSSSQVEPVRILGNQITSLTGSHNRGIYLTQLDAGPYEVRDNVIDGITHGGNRSDPADYTFSEGISFQNLEANGEVTGNTFSGTHVTFLADGGTGSSSIDDNTASASWSPVSVHNGAQMTAHSNDFTDYVVAIDPNEPFASGALTCNWWGAATGPAGVDAGIASDVYRPWATASVAGTSTTSCTGGLGTLQLAIFCPGDGVPETFELLEDAVSAVVEGGTIEVCDGTHTVVQETVDKAVTFEGAAGTLPTITTGGAQFGITFAFASGTTTIRNLRFETLWNLGFDHVVGSALLIGGPGPLPYDQVVIEDVELHVANGSSGENAGSGAWIFSSNVAGAHVTVRNVTATGGGAGLNILTLSEATLGASVDVLNSSFSSPGRNGIRVASLSANSASGAISDVDIDNVDVTAGLGVFVLGGNGGVGGRVDVTNSTFSGGAGMWYQNGGSGLIQNNTIACGHSNACIRVRSDGSSSQVEPVRILGNQITSLTGSHNRGIYLTQLDAGPYEVRDNVIDGITHGGNRSDPADYTFGEGISFQNLEANGEVTGNTISGTHVTFLADGGTGSSSIDDNTASASWSPVSVHNGAQMTAHSNDFTDYQAAIDANEPFGTGDLTCNWWGAATGPTGLFASIAADVYTPWATTPVAGTSTTTCSGGP